MKWIRPLVFWPPVILLLLALLFSLMDFSGFHTSVTTANDWILSKFDWLFRLASFAAVCLLVWVFMSPMGQVRIGGPDATPILKRWNWFAITLCTTIATGILFWGTAEPMFHVNNPPNFANVEARSDGAARFAISTLFMHWTITPYAIYSVSGLAFALAHYNLGRPYSLSGPLSLIFGKWATGRGGSIIDAVGLYALVAGVAASLGAGVMTIGGGLDAVAGIGDGAGLRLAITIAIVILFVVSSISGIQRGIKYLSDINIRFFFILCAFVFITGPTFEIISLGFHGVVEYVVNFIPRSLAIGGAGEAEWSRDWTVFYFANWLAWAPITALFLGRISVGYTVREFLLFNLVAPAGFGAVWMAVFGGAAIKLDTETSGTLTRALENNGPEAVIYALFNALPFSGVVAFVFVVLTFVSFVTAMDSNTHSITGICLKVNVPGGQQGRPALVMKVFWGVLVGAVAWVMTATTGIAGIRMLSNLGGLPGLFILISMGAVVCSLQTVWFDEVRLACQPAK